MATLTGRPAAYIIAVVAGILGGGSLVLFGLFLWTGGFRLIDMRMEQRSALAWDAGLCILFFLQHSGMVRNSFRAWMNRFVPDFCNGVIYTIASGAALLLLVGYWQPTASMYSLDGAGRWAMRGVLLLSLAGFLWAIRSLEEFDAFGIQAFLSRVQRQRLPSAKLTIRGPYRLVRHPFYCCGIVALWASPVFSLDRLVLSSLFTAWIVLGARFEERDLLKEFGEDYARYQRKVPMFIPRLP